MAKNQTGSASAKMEDLTPDKVQEAFTQAISIMSSYYIKCVNAGASGAAGQGQSGESAVLQAALASEKYTISVEEISEKCDISKGKAYELTRRQDFPAIRDGNRIIIPRAKFLEWLNNTATKGQ